MQKRADFASCWTMSSMKGDVNQQQQCIPSVFQKEGSNHLVVQGWIAGFWSLVPFAKKGCEILTSIYPAKGSDYFLQLAGVKVAYNPNSIIFYRVTDLWTGDEENGYKKLDRIMAEPSWNPYHLVRNGTWVTWTAVGVLAFCLCMVAGLVSYIRKKLK